VGERALRSLSTVVMSCRVGVLYTCRGVSPRGWCGFRRNCSGGGYKVCRGDKVGRVLLDGVGDRLLERGVRFQVDEKEADVCFKLLPESCDGVFVVRQFRFQVGEEAGVLSDEIRQSFDLLQNALCAHKWGRWCPEWQVASEDKFSRC
jgi:hypothetical protein